MAYHTNAFDGSANLTAGPSAKLERLHHERFWKAASIRQFEGVLRARGSLEGTPLMLAAIHSLSSISFIGTQLTYLFRTLSDNNSIVKGWKEKYLEKVEDTSLTNQAFKDGKATIV